MPKMLRDYNTEEKEAFAKLFESVKGDTFKEAIASKFYRHEYCLIQKDLTESVVIWFKACGLNVEITDTSHWLQDQIELV